MGMKGMLLLAIVGIAAAFTVGACGDDDDGGGGSDPCADADAVENQAISDYCADKTDYCCYCQCWESSYGTYDQGAYMDNQTCTCVDPPATEPAPCEGATLEIADTCLADEVACGEDAVETIEPVCDNTPI